MWVPPCEPHRWTARLGLATPFLICSKALSVKIANVLANGMYPFDAIPAATKSIFCSPMPQETVLSGCSFRKCRDFVDLPKSASSTTTFSFSASASNASPYPSLVAAIRVMLSPPVLQELLRVVHRKVLLHGMQGCFPCKRPLCL